MGGWGHRLPHNGLQDFVNDSTIARKHVNLGESYFFLLLKNQRSPGWHSSVGQCPTKQKVAGLTPSQAHAWVVSRAPPTGAHRRGKQSMFLASMFLSLSPSLPLSLKLTKSALADVAQ